MNAHHTHTAPTPPATVLPAPVLLATALLGLILSGCDTIHGQTDTAENSGTWTGTETYLYGYGLSADEFACELNYVASGTPATMPCAKCTFAFEVTLSYDESTSTDPGNACTRYTQDRTEIYAYYPDYYGNGAYIGTRYAGAFYVLGPASFDESTGALVYDYGENEPYGYYTYYTDQFSGVATIQ